MITPDTTIFVILSLSRPNGPSFFQIRIRMRPTLSAGQHGLPSRLASRCGLRFVQSMRKILVRRSFSSRSLVRGSLGNIPIRVSPVSETSKASLFTDFAGNEREYGVQAHKLAVKLIVCI
jgi:hypothetical protein